MVKIASAAAGAVVLAAAVAAQPSINSPASLIQCQPTALSWSNAQGTVRLFVLPAGEVSAAHIEDLPNQSGASGSYVWTVNLAAGRNITLAVSDDSGTTGYASPVVIMSGSDSSCLNAAASSSSSGTAAGAAGASSTRASSSAASSTAASSSAASSSASSSAATSSAASRTSSAASGASSVVSSASSAASSAAPTRSSNGAAAFSPSTAGLAVLGLAGALLPFF